MRRSAPLLLYVSNPVRTIRKKVMSESTDQASYEAVINAPGEARDIIITYDHESEHLHYSIVDRPLIEFDLADIVLQLNCLDLGCSFSESELRVWTEEAESLEAALEAVSNMVAVQFCVRDGYMISYVDETGKTTYAVTAEGAKRAGVSRLAS